MVVEFLRGCLWEISRFWAMASPWPGSRRRDQRPAKATLAVALPLRLLTLWLEKDNRFSNGVSNARRPSKLSAVTHPWAANSARASAAREGSKLRSFKSSLKNSAPRRWKSSSTCDVSGESSGVIGGGDSASQCGRFSRENRAIGEDRIGAS